MSAWGQVEGSIVEFSMEKVAVHDRAAFVLGLWGVWHDGLVGEGLPITK